MLFISNKELVGRKRTFKRTTLCSGDYIVLRKYSRNRNDTLRVAHPIGNEKDLCPLYIPTSFSYFRELNKSQEWQLDINSGVLNNEAENYRCQNEITLLENLLIGANLSEKALSTEELNEVKNFDGADFFFSLLTNPQKKSYAGYTEQYYVLK